MSHDLLVQVAYEGRDLRQMFEYGLSGDWHFIVVNYKLRLRVRFFTETQDWIFKSVRIQKQILRFFTRQINPRSLGASKEPRNPLAGGGFSSVPLTHHA